MVADGQIGLGVMLPAAVIAGGLIGALALGFTGGGRLPAQPGMRRAREAATSGDIGSPPGGQGVRHPLTRMHVESGRKEDHAMIPRGRSIRRKETEVAIDEAESGERRTG